MHNKEVSIIDTLIAPASKGCHLLTSDPGARKTFTIKHLLNTFLDNGVKVCVCATNGAVATPFTRRLQLCTSYSKSIHATYTSHHWMLRDILTS